jgi:DNA-binding IclR family transcriptional regulator
MLSRRVKMPTFQFYPGDCTPVTADDIAARIQSRADHVRPLLAELEACGVVGRAADGAYTFGVNPIREDR